MNQDIELLKLITVPFAFTSEHVQGPGGNTSVKVKDRLLIKASGFTFANVAQNEGVVALNNATIVDTLVSRLHLVGQVFENSAPAILYSQPEGLKPSMEFEFHAVLNKYVLHTHSVYVNVLTCCAECENFLSRIFVGIEYALIPYVTPGFPIAAQILKQFPDYNFPSIIFLKNHGIIIHGNSHEEVLATYNKVESSIKTYLQLPELSNLSLVKNNIGYFIDNNGLLAFNIDISTFEELLLNKVLIPDQSIFFKDKVSSTNKLDNGVFIDYENNLIVINGTQKFITAAEAMIQAVYYIYNNISRLGLTPDYITLELINVMHALSTEKYRAATLKNN